MTPRRSTREQTHCSGSPRLHPAAPRSVGTPCLRARVRYCALAKIDRSLVECEVRVLIKVCGPRGIPHEARRSRSRRGSTKQIASRPRTYGSRTGVLRLIGIHLRRWAGRGSLISLFDRSRRRPERHAKPGGRLRQRRHAQSNEQSRADDAGEDTSVKIAGIQLRLFCF